MDFRITRVSSSNFSVDSQSPLMPVLEDVCTPEQQLNRLHTFFLSFRKEVFERLDKLEQLILDTRARADPPTRCTAMMAPQAPTAFMAETTWEDSSVVVAPSTTTTTRVPMSDLNGRSYDVTTAKVSSVDD